jgi:hypothetical protein
LFFKGWLPAFVVGCFFAPAGAFGQQAEETSVCTFNVRYDNPDDTLKWFERRDEVANEERYIDLDALQEELPNK